MARIRTIKPDFFMSEDIGGLTVKTRLLYVALWCHADREGKMKFSPVALAAQTMPYEMSDFNECMNELVEKEHIVKYEVECTKYLFIPTFLEHQRPHKTEAASKIPDYEGELTVSSPLEDVGSRTGKGKGKGKGYSLASESIVVEVLDYLNLVCGKNYRASTAKNVTLINARVNDGYVLEDFKHVIEVKGEQWKGDTNNDKYLRPETLFGTKFEGYRNEKGEPYMVRTVDGVHTEFQTKEDYEAFQKEMSDYE